jgi:hypothetical protein
LAFTLPFRIFCPALQNIFKNRDFFTADYTDQTDSSLLAAVFLGGGLKSAAP